MFVEHLLHASSVLEARGAGWGWALTPDFGLAGQLNP